MQGVGDTCWYCGTNAIKRSGVTYPVNAHRHDPLKIDKAWEDVDHYYERTS